MRIVFRHLPNFVLRMLRRWPIQFASKASIYKVRILQFFCCVWCLIRVRVHDTRTTFYILDITGVHVSMSCPVSMWVSVLHRLAQTMVRLWFLLLYYSNVVYFPIHTYIILICYRMRERDLAFLLCPNSPLWLFGGFWYHCWYSEMRDGKFGNDE